MIHIRSIAPSDYESWCALYQSYAEFYLVSQTKEMRDQIWAWIHDRNHEVNGLVAIDSEGAVVGLAHYRSFSRPLTASTGGFLDDLFVASSARGNEIGKKLVEAIADIGKQKNWSVIRWITAENNYRARSAYDKFACRTNWVTYDIKL